MTKDAVSLVGVIGCVCVLLGTVTTVRPRAADADLVIGGAAGAMQPLRGIDAGPLGDLTNPNLTSAYLQRGVNLIRTHDFDGPLDMGSMYPDRSKNPLLASSFNFSAPVGTQFRSSDDVYRAIVNGGFEAYFRLGDSDGNSVPTASQHPNWEQAALQVIRHFRDGQFNGFISTLRYIEIWNEANNQAFWPAPNTAADYYALYAETAALLKNAILSLIVGGPAVGSSGCTSIPAYGVQLVTVGSAPASTQAFNAWSNALGSSSAQTLDVTFTTNAADIGQAGVTYIAALLDGQFYFFSNGAWSPYTSGAYPVYSTGLLPSSNTIRVLAQSDVRRYRGAAIYVAYGRSQADMLARGLYKLVYTL
jgi:hypothetical protein